MNEPTDSASPWIAHLRSARGIGALFVAALLFGVHNVFTKYAYDDGATPLAVAVARLWLVALIAAMVLRARGSRLFLGSGATRLLLLVAALFCFHNWGIMEAFRFLPVSLIVLVVYLYPIMVGFMAAALGWSRLTGFGLGAAFAGFAGIALVLEIGSVALNPWGLALAFLCAFALGANFLGAERLAAGASSAAVLFNLSLIGAGVLTIVGVLGDSIAWPRGIAGRLYLAGAAGVAPIALLAQYSGIATIGAPRAALVMNCEPVLMMLLAALFLGERIGPWQIAGATLVVGAIAALARRELARRPTGHE